ncbi:MAG: tetratricopeptide repeat protein [Gammaproteobacteria bacterium]
MVLLIYAGYAAANSSIYGIIDKALQAENFAEAWKLASANSESHAGEPEFDYLYGLAALGTGHFSEAVFALERAVENAPENIEYNLALTEAHLKLHDDRQAASRLESVILMNPDDNIRQRIRNYQDILGKRTRKHDRWSGSITILGGYDDNPLLSSDIGFFDGPRFTSFKNLQKPEDDGFGEAHVNLNYQNRLDENLTAFSTLDLFHRQYGSTPDGDYSYLDFKGGAVWENRPDGRQYWLNVGMLPILRDGELESYRGTLNLSMNQYLSDGYSLSLGATFSAYVNEKLAHYNRGGLILGAALNKQTETRLHQLLVNFGGEEPESSGGDEFTRNFVRLGYSLTQQWNFDHQSSFIVYGQHSEYQGVDSLFRHRRIDNLLIVELSHNWALTKDLSLVTEFSHTENWSTLDAYEYDRNQVTLGFRYHFL